MTSEQRILSFDELLQVRDKDKAQGFSDAKWRALLGTKGNLLVREVLRIVLKSENCQTIEQRRETYKFMQETMPESVDFVHHIGAILVLDDKSLRSVSRVLKSLEASDQKLVAQGKSN